MRNICKHKNTQSLMGFDAGKLTEVDGICGPLDKMITDIEWCLYCGATRINGIYTNGTEKFTRSSKWKSPQLAKQ